MVLCVPKLQKKRVLEKSKEKKMSLKDKFKKASKEVKERVEYIRGDKGILEQKYQETKKISPEDKLGEFRRIAVLGGIDLAWFLFCLGKFAGKDLKTIFVDNKIILFCKANCSKNS